MGAGATDGALSRAVERACSGTISAIRRIPTMGVSGVYQAEIDGRPIVVKDQPDITLVDIEVWGLQRFAALGVRVPAVLAVDASRDVHPHPFFVTEYVDGVSITALADAEDALVELGSQLRTIHEVTAEGYGLLIGADGTPGVGQFATLYDAMWVFSEFGISGLERNGWLDAASARRVREFRDSHREDLVSSPPMLLHGDVKAEHVIIDPRSGRLVGLIDPHPWSGEPAYDLARLVATGGERMRRSLLTGYGEPRVDLDARWLLHELSFLVAITFGHRIHNQEAGADPEGWTARLRAAIDRLP